MVAESEQTSEPSKNPPTVSVVLSIMVAIIILLCIYAANRTSALVVIRETVRTRRLRRAGPQGVGEETLQSMPVLKYDEELLARPGYQGSRRVPLWRRILRTMHIPTLATEHNPNSGVVPSPSRRWYSPRHHPLKQQHQHPSTHTCAICTEDFLPGTDVRKLPCGHIFHPACIDRWLLDFAVTCPLWQVKPHFEFTYIT